MERLHGIRTAFVVYQVGTYHSARLDALQKIVDLHVVPLSSHSYLREWRVESRAEHKPLFPDVSKERNKTILAELRRRLEEISPDVVVVSGYFYPAMREAARWAKQNGRGSILLSESNYFDRKRFFLTERLKGAWLRRYFDACFVGGARSQQYHEYLGFPSHQIWSGYDVVDNDYFYRMAGEARRHLNKPRNALNLPKKYFLYVGRFSSEKNLDRLLRSFAKLSRDPMASGWGLVMTGGGPLEKQLREMCDREQIPNVIWSGFLQMDQLPAIYSAASVLILPSAREPWGLVVNEAMACGLPVLVSNRCGSALDLVDQGVNGWTFDPFSDEDILFAMKRAILNEDQLPIMGKQSLEIISRYSPQRSATSLADCIETVSLRRCS